MVAPTGIEPATHGLGTLKAWFAVICHWLPTAMIPAAQDYPRLSPFVKIRRNWCQSWCQKFASVPPYPLYMSSHPKSAYPNYPDAYFR